MGAEIFPTYGAQLAEDALVNGEPAIITSGDTTSGSTSVINIPSTALMSASMSVWGATVETTVPTIVSKTSTTIVLTAPADKTQVGAALLVTEDALLNDFILQGKDVHLFTDALGTPTPATDLAELQAAEAVYTGYAPVAGVWSVDAVGPQGQAVAESQAFVFSGPASGPGETIAGAWVDNGTGALRIWLFDVPVALDGPTDLLKFMLFDNYPTPGQVITIYP